MKTKFFLAALAVSFSLAMASCGGNKTVNSEAAADSTAVEQPVCSTEAATCCKADSATCDTTKSCCKEKQACSKEKKECCKEKGACDKKK